jgi:hypothetical protein
MRIDIEIPEEEETITFEPLPAGWYAAKITSVEDVTTNAGDAAVKIFFLVENGRTVNSWLNLGHSAPDTKARAIRDVESLGRAGGLARVGDSSELDGLSMEIRLTIKEGGEWNEVNGYRRLVSSAPPSGNAAPKGNTPWLAQQ